MKILIVEDQKEKSDDIVKFFKEGNTTNLEVSIQQSLRSGLKDLVSNLDYDLIVLDMSMPNFDPSAEDPMGGTHESFAGREFLSQMELREISTPTVVVTQYATFAKGQITLEKLDQLLKHSYPKFYLGSVYYSSAEDSWKDTLRRLIKDL